MIDVRNFNSINLLICEDDPILRVVYEKMFSEYPINIMALAKDGKDGVRAFLDHQDTIDIILMDFRMPRMNGIEAMREILDINPKAKIIFLSADETIKRQALRMGARSFLSKPCSIKELISLIQEVHER